MDAILVVRTGIFAMIAVLAVGGLLSMVAVSIIECLPTLVDTNRAWRVLLPFVGGALLMWVIAILCDSLTYVILDSGG